METFRLYFVGFVLVAVGLFIVLAGSASSSSASFGGVVFVGPFPIVFGSGPDSGTLVIASLIIVALMVAVFYASFLRSRRTVT